MIQAHVKLLPGFVEVEISVEALGSKDDVNTLSLFDDATGFWGGGSRFTRIPSARARSSISLSIVFTCIGLCSDE